jgi:hypothetical protein
MNQRELIVWRMARNLANTGHPLHHRTADGTIVDADPTLQEWMATCDDVPPVPSYDPKLATPAVPVNRRHYGFDLYLYAKD